MVVAIDSMPERRLVKQTAANFPGIVVIAQYNETTDAKPISYNPVDNVVSVNRTDAIGAMLDGIRQGRHLLPAEPPRFYVEHLAALKRRLVRDLKGRPHYQYITAGSHGDDFAHAETYDLVAKEVLTLKLAEMSWPDENEEVVVGHVEDVRLTAGDDYSPGFM
jgi:hypothetical protein